MRLFAPASVVDGAEAVLRAIVEISLKPSVELRQLAKEALSKRLDPDPLLAFSSFAVPIWTMCTERSPKRCGFATNIARGCGDAPTISGYSPRHRDQ